MSEPAQARLLWDAGGLWSLMTHEAARAQGLELSPITASEIAAGGLAHARLLVAPGGWPALKRKALGPEGGEAVRRFVAQGGSYLGFCGGAGLALDVADGLGLISLGRTSRAKRLPSLSGPVFCEPGPDAHGHPLWRGQALPARFLVWFPGQFALDGGKDIKVLARYTGPAPGLCSADLRADEISPGEWPALERAYGLKLDPAAMAGLPAVIEAPSGQGTVLLSYLHFDTPGDAPGGRALRNLWRGWLGQDPGRSRPLAYSHAAPLARATLDLWREGERLGLWQKRHSAMPLWQRGSRGLEFWSLYRLCLAAGSLSRGRACSELESLLGPVWRDGPAVLAVQAARLAGQEPTGPGADIETRWFPRPRRMGGDLARALDALETALLGLIREGCAH